MVVTERSSPSPTSALDSQNSLFSETPLPPRRKLIDQLFLSHAQLLVSTRREVILTVLAISSSFTAL
jgi:hypothetical protein